MRKIALFMPTAVEGGVQRVFINLAKGFLRRGYQVDIVLSKAIGRMLNHIPDHCNVVDLGVNFGRGDLKALLSTSRLRRYLKSHKPDILIAAPGVSGIVSIWAKNSLKVKVILLVDNKVTLLKKGKWHHKLTYYLVKLFYRYADFIVTAHQSAEEDIKSNIPISSEKVRTIYHPLIDEEMYRSVEVSADNQAKVSKQKVILGVGRLVKEKDFITLISAFKYVSEQIFSKLIIIGEGPERRSIEDHISKLDLQPLVELPGWVDDPIEYMKNADLVVVSSVSEAFGNVIVEALSVGTPVVATNCASGGPAEILNHGEFGVLCPPSNVDELANGIIKALQVEYDKHKLIERSKLFTIQKSVSLYEEVINALQR